MERDGDLGGISIRSTNVFLGGHESVHLSDLDMGRLAY